MVIIEVFNRIFIGNFHDANDIYKLIQLNIGGVLSCIYFNHLNWCSEQLEDSQIYYKHNFIKCKKKLSRITGELSENEIKEDDNKKIEAKEEKKEENIKSECTDKNNSNCYFTNHMHYDFIVFPAEIKINTLDETKKQPYINLLNDVENSKPVDFFLLKDRNCSYNKLGNSSKETKNTEKEKENVKEENKENKKSQIVDMLKCKEATNENSDIGNAVNIDKLNECLQKENKIPIPNVYTMKHLYLDIDDTFDENILNFFEKAHEFIDSVLSENKNILIHCLAGISRCSTIILSYISKKNKKGIEENYTDMKKKYPFAHPNDNFYQQLLLYEKMNYTLNVTDSQ